ncbi:endonuclease/exonuclease/phosphatase family protein [uncultured Chryseobacterium sp.]|uniref:endonuclease/exonuclease/phosphatase family protein n=1 Tax=uncultured Chryseobacterium sp. TaxID=259322 RepID=UPI0025DD2FE8|nr:endonuclease/exonuclease/phosphatase family protein [uncultured Chryseobacterium sp.]
MKIATLNIDWARRKGSSETAAFLNRFNFDFLILTEAVDLKLDKFPYQYYCSPIPENTVYENLNYTEYLKGKRAFRTILYSKIPYSKKYPVADQNTNLALEFETASGTVVFYCTIIGTWFNRQPFADKELWNTISDCRKIHAENTNLFIIGDFNTSFRSGEEKFSISRKTTAALTALFDDLQLINTTRQIRENIDHIVVPECFAGNITEAATFVDKHIVSDHQGIFISIS